MTTPRSPADLSWWEAASKEQKQARAVWRALELVLCELQDQDVHDMPRSLAVKVNGALHQVKDAMKEAERIVQG